ncbi:MAG TPA: methyltransferase domain-containing protein [Acidimicrobiia bacterium]
MDANAAHGNAGTRARRVAKLKRRSRSAISRVLRNRPIQLRSRSLRSRDYLDIGCGSNVHSSFINLNYQWLRGVNLCWDLVQGLPLPDESVRGVFSEHCIEHLPLDAGDHVLEECYRVLKPGGTLRIVVPDGELYLTAYARNVAGDEVRLPFSEGDRYESIYTPIMSVNRIFGNFGHRFIYDYATLRELLGRHGFVDIERAAFRAGRDPVLLIDTEKRAPESLYVEATKPANPSAVPAG